MVLYPFSMPCVRMFTLSMCTHIRFCWLVTLCGTCSCPGASSTRLVQEHGMSSLALDPLPLSAGPISTHFASTAYCQHLLGQIRCSNPVPAKQSTADAVSFLVSSTTVLQVGESWRASFVVSNTRITFIKFGHPLITHPSAPAAVQGVMCS